MLDKIKNTSPKLKNFKGTGTIIAVSTSKEKGTKKRNVTSAILEEDSGIRGDAHAGAKKRYPYTLAPFRAQAGTGGHRQVSLLALESIEKMKVKGLKVGPGDFAENITTAGINLLRLKVGTKLKIGKQAILEISQIGKECHTRCSIYEQAGDCVMPREGVFTRVLKGGAIKPGDRLEVVLCNTNKGAIMARGGEGSSPKSAAKENSVR